MFGSKRKGVAGKVARIVSSAPNLSDDANRDPMWQAWAEGLGFRYQLDGSELVGRYFEIRPVSRRSGEEYTSVIRGTWGGYPIIFFVRRTWHSGSESPVPEVSGGPNFVLQLPGALPADVLAMTPDQAVKALGGGLPATGNYQWHGRDALLWTGRLQNPQHLEGILQSITMQLAMAPADLWER